MAALRALLGPSRSGSPLLRIDASAELLAALERELDVRGPERVTEALAIVIGLGWSLPRGIVRLYFADGTSLESSL